MSIKLFFTKIINHVFLIYELVIGNRRLIIPTMIGLIVALTVISQTGVLIESYRQEIFDETVIKELERYGDYQGDVSIEFWQRNVQHEGKLDLSSDFESYKSIVNRSINQVDYSDYVQDHYWFCRFGNYIWLNSTDEYLEEGMITQHTPIWVSSEHRFYSKLDHLLNSTNKGRLPKNSSEIILIQNSWQFGHYYIEEQISGNSFENVTLGSKVNITSTPKWHSGGPNKTVTIVGIIEHTGLSDNSTSLLTKYFQGFWTYGFITTPIFLDQIYTDLFYSLSEPDVQIIGKIFLDQSRFDSYNFKGEMNNLLNFIRALKHFFQNSYPYIYSYLLESMSQFESSISALLIIMLLFSFPVLCIALYLVTYSLTLIKRQKQEQIGILKTRGGSSLQILVILLGEMIISTILAVFIGLLFSTFLADVVLRSTDYIEFFGSSVPVKISIGMIQALFFWGLFFALVLNFRNIIRMSRQKISETLTPIETRNPLWKRYYLDIAMFLLGTITWIILTTLIRMSNEAEIITEENILIYQLMMLLGIPAPFMMFFGTIMVITRFFPFIMTRLANILWKIEGGINAFSIRNIVRHKQAANRAVLLITLALSFSILSSSLIFSMDETERLSLYYEGGADLSINTGEFLNESVLNILQQNISHLESISGLYKAQHYPTEEYREVYHFLFVDPSTYAQTAYTNPIFKLSSSLNSLMNQINDNKTIILHEANLKADVSKPKIGGNISLQFRNDTNSKHISFNIGGTFKYWPKLYPYEWYDKQLWIIGSLGMFYQLNKTYQFSSVYAIYQAKIDSLSNTEDTVVKIQNVTGIKPLSPALSFKEYKENFGRRFSLSILNSDLIISLTVAVIGVIMFAFFTYVERGKEIGVERALGMTQFQTAQSFLIEAATILCFGCVIGYFTGVYFTSMFLQITQFGESIPPMVVSYPTALLIQIILGILITAGIGTIIPAYISTRKDISRILKVE